MHNTVSHQFSFDFLLRAEHLLRLPFNIKLCNSPSFVTSLYSVWFAAFANLTINDLITVISQTILVFLL